MAMTGGAATTGRLVPWTPSILDRLRHSLLSVAGVLCPVLVAGCLNEGTLRSAELAEPTPAIAYTVELEGSPSDEITDLAGRSLLSYRLAHRGAPNRAFLRRRVEQDEAQLATILRSQSYYAASISSRIAERSDEAAIVTFSIRPGRVFTLTEHTLTIERRRVWTRCECPKRVQAMRR